MDIKTLLKKYGETTYTIADKMGIAQPSVMQYVNGKPTARKLEEIARAIGYSPAKFFANWQAPSPASPPQWHGFSWSMFRRRNQTFRYKKRTPRKRCPCEIGRFIGAEDPSLKTAGCAPSYGVTLVFWVQS